MPRIVCAFLFVVLLACPSMAENPKNLDQLVGKWSYSRVNGQFVIVGEAELVIDGTGLKGDATYHDRNELKQDVLSNFELKSSDRVWFVATTPKGKTIRHMGKMSHDGNTIKGNCSFGFSTGRFILNKIGAGDVPAMTGKWEYHVEDPSGGAGQFANMIVFSDVAGQFEGYTHYRSIETSPKSTKGTVAKDGTLSFSVFEKGEYVHTGKLSKDGKSASGVWKNAETGEGQFTLKLMSQ